jgi:hypothetical protein
LVVNRIARLGFEVRWNRAYNTRQILAPVYDYFLPHQHPVIKAANSRKAEKPLINFCYRGPNLIQVRRQHYLPAGGFALLSKFYTDDAAHPVSFNNINQRRHFLGNDCVDIVRATVTKNANGLRQAFKSFRGYGDFGFYGHL